MFAQNNNNVPNPRDRFIPLRLSENARLDENVSNRELCPEMFTNFAKTRFHSSHYRKALKSVLMPFHSKVLNFFPPKDDEDDDSTSSEHWRWPVKRRKKPVLEAPTLVLDLPQFEINFYNNLADWGKNNKLIVIFTGEVHIWSRLLSAPMDLQGRVSQTGGEAQMCVKWNKSGTHFGVSLFRNSLGIYDVQANKIIHRSVCCDYCTVTCMDWVDDNFLLTGCRSGTLKSRTFELHVITNIEAHKESIVTVTASCQGNYAATSSIDKTVKIWTLPHLQVLILLQLGYVNSRTIAWHPWREMFLATGYKNQLLVWKIGESYRECFIAEQKHFHKKVMIDALTFNPISGELVVSHYVTGRGSFGVLTVNADFRMPSEELFIKKEKFFYLLWGDEGRTLGAVSTEENLYLWDFFGTENEKKNKIDKNKTTYTTNSLQNMNAFNTYLR